MKKLNHVIGMFFLAIVLISGCEKEKKSTAPQLPPLTSFALPVENFTAAKSDGPYANFLAAVAVTGYWNNVLATYLAVPVASYAEAFNHDAVRLDNNTYEWTYEVTVNDTVYTANLLAFLETEGVTMEMHISQAGGFQDFVWYSGSFNYTRTEGEWIIQDNPENNASWMNIAWHHDWDKKTFDIKYTNIYPTGEYKDSYINYGIRTDNPYNAFYEIYNSVQDKTYAIDFNTTSHEGRIYYDALYHCWDSNYQDIICSE